jgi:hypothetical protein
MSVPTHQPLDKNAQTRQPRELLLIWWSVTDGTRQLTLAASAAAQAAVDGESLVQVRTLRCDEATPADLLAADAYLFATPEMLGSMAGRMKDLFDRCYYPVLDGLAGRAYALMVCAGSDGQGAVRQLQRICTGWRLRPVAEPLVVCTEAQTPQAITARKQILPGQLEQAEQLGASLAAGLALGLW